MHQPACQAKLIACKSVRSFPDLHTSALYNSLNQDTCTVSCEALTLFRPISTNHYNPFIARQRSIIKLLDHFPED